MQRLFIVPTMYLSAVPTNGMVIHKTNIWNECVPINSNLNITISCCTNIKSFRPLISRTEHQFKLIYRIALSAFKHIPN